LAEVAESTTPESTPSDAAPSYAQLDALYTEAVVYVRHLEAGYQQSQAQVTHVETIYAELAAYAKQLEQAVSDHKQAAVESSQYIARLETELAALRQTNDDGRAYVESLLAQIQALTAQTRRLEVKLHDMEENLRQYQ